MLIKRRHFFFFQPADYHEFKRLKISKVSIDMGKLSYILMGVNIEWGFPGGSVVKNPPANAGTVGDLGLIPVLGRSPGIGNGNPLQYSCLDNPVDREAWGATIHGVAKKQTRLK